MNFKLVDSGWGSILDQALRANRSGSRLRIICPFIKKRAIQRFVKGAIRKQFEVITRFDLDGFRAKVSDTSALRSLLAAGAQIRGIRNLHSKVYLVGKRAIVTSANLTEQALNRNHEFGFSSDDPAIVSSCDAYFDSLWRNAGADLVTSKIDEWDARVSKAVAAAAAAGASTAPGLGDEGVDLGFSAESSAAPKPMNSSEQGFVKFFGIGKDRGSPSMKVLAEVDSSTSHWALSYPTSKTPRNVRDGALMFIARLAKPNDILIYGRGIGTHYRPGVDDATPGDIGKRPWKQHWSRYIHVDDVEFINGTLADGVSLNELMKNLRHLSFATTKARYLRGERNINPRTAYARQAQVELTPEAIVWLNDRLDRNFAQHGKISQDALDDLVQPEL